MAIPEVVLIGSIPYRIVEKEDVVIGDAVVAGAFDYGRGEICLREGLNPFAKACILAHEIVHGLLIDNRDIDEDTLERVCDVIGDKLPQLIRENVEVFEYMASPHAYEDDDELCDRCESCTCTKEDDETTTEESEQPDDSS